MTPKENILDTIVAQKRREIETLPRQRITPELLQAAASARGGVRNFFERLRLAHPAPALIAEIKKASPSAGVICPNFDPVRIAAEYERSGAACLSVLTDERFFQGSLRYLKQVRSAVALPLLRKDFIIDERQILEAIEWGADAILLIVAILNDEQLSRLLELAQAAGLAALVEVHDEAELNRALRAGARLLGVNNRNLKTFQVDLGTTERLAAKIRAAQPPHHCLLVAESGIHTRADVERLSRAGAEAILVGESLMRDGNVAAKIRELLGPDGGSPRPK